MPEDRFSPGPASRLACAFITACEISFVKDMCLLCAVFAVTAAYALYSGTYREKSTRRSFAAAQLFLALIWLTVPWSVQGNILWSWGGFAVSREGLVLAFRVTLKCGIILMFFQTMLSGISIEEFAAALQRLRVPKKGVYLLAVMMRYIFSTWEEVDTLREAAKLRGFQSKMSMHAYRTIASLLALTLVHSLERAARVWEAMQLRGFSGKWHSLDYTAPGQNPIPFLCTLSCIWAGIAAAAIWLRP
jgi:cobalt/nickel transport system permease protein